MSDGEAKLAVVCGQRLRAGSGCQHSEPLLLKGQTQASLLLLQVIDVLSCRSQLLYLDVRRLSAASERYRQLLGIRFGSRQRFACLAEFGLRGAVAVNLCRLGVQSIELLAGRIDISGQRQACRLDRFKRAARQVDCLE
ncbi:hypothetical protein EGM70_09725 [Enterobacteriaceae bacterium 89]|nr:hypothetical protein [Enterobacteriaceae bacterium 89]